MINRSFNSLQVRYYVIHSTKCTAPNMIQVSIPYRYGITCWWNCKKTQQRIQLVSIPYRYGITYGRFSDVKGNPVYWFQFLIGTVLHFLNRRRLKMTKRRKLFQFLIGTVLQQCFRCFPALSSFFVSNLFKKSVDLTFLLSQISLKNQVFYKN